MQLSVVKSGAAKPASDLLGTSTESAARLKAKTAAGPADVVDIQQAARLKNRRELWKLQRSAQALLRGHRVELCQRALNRGMVGIDQCPDSKRASFGGLISCGNRWACPVCADRITEEERERIQTAMAISKRMGLVAYLATFTFPHDLSMKLDDGLERMQVAQRKLKSMAKYKKLMKEIGCIGSIKALELTCAGDNGWHPHVHMIYFAKPNKLDELGTIRGMWADRVEAAGLGKINEHGFDVRGGDYASDYIAKFGKEPSEETRKKVRAWWTAAHELTKGHTKQSQRMGGVTPFTLLRWYSEHNDKQAGAMFVEFVDAFKGRAQLYWSPGLKDQLDLFGLEIEKPKKPAPIRVMNLDAEDWSAVLRHNARWELLYVIEKYGVGEAQQMVARMRSSKGTHSGAFKWADGFGRIDGTYTEVRAGGQWVGMAA